MVMDRRQSERQLNDTEAKEAGKCRERKALILLQLGALQRQRDRAAGLSQLGQDVAHRRHTEFVIGEFGGRKPLQRRRPAHHFDDAFADARENALDHRIGLRVDRGTVKRIIAVVDAQEACGLLEGLVAQARHLA